MLSMTGGLVTIFIGLYDHTTIEIAWPYGWALWLFVPTLAAIGTAQHHFVAPGGDEAQIAHWHLKRERPALWVIFGIAGSVLIGAVCAFMLYPLIASLPEHTGREALPVDARVLEVRTVYGARARCRTRIVLEMTGGKSEDVCLITGFFAKRAIAAFDPVINEKVRVTLRRGIFGVSVCKIERDSQQLSTRDRLANRWSGRVGDKVPSPYCGARAAQLNP